MMPRKIRVMFATATALGLCVVIFQLCLILRDSGRLSLSDDDVPVILWWTPFGNSNRVRTCGNARCYLTYDRAFESSARLRVRVPLRPSGKSFAEGETAGQNHVHQCPLMSSGRYFILFSLYNAPARLNAQANSQETLSNAESLYATMPSAVSPLSILFYGSNLRVRDLPNWRSGAATWGLLHEESPRNNPVLVHEEALNLFNYSSTFSRFSNVPLTLLDLSDVEELVGESYYISTKEKSALMQAKDLAPVLYIQSDCDTASDRDRYVLELMKHIRIDSYGTCVNNAQLDDRLKNNYLDILNNREFLSFVAKYKFTIAFENAICDDYITEKLWRPLIVGSVPIYYGSPSFKDWLPNNKSAISILDFAGPIELAKFLHNLLKNDSAYEEYLPHKLSKRENRVANSELLRMLERRPTAISNEFGKYVDEFECFVCEQIQKNNHKLEKSVVTKRQYNCSLPRDPITGEINKRNWWMEQWTIEKCGAKLLTRYISNNISININSFVDQKMHMYDNNEC